jgi:simple sugar transport system substrate-binding protein
MIRRKSVVLLAALVVPVLATSACSSSNAVNRVSNKAGSGSGGYGYKIAVVTHGGAGDSFWSIVKAGAVRGGKDMGDTVTYQSDGDPTNQAKLIDNAVNQKPDGLVVSMANPQALKAAVQRAVAAGIPVITINAGDAESKAYGALSHIGSNEQVAGEAVGTKLKSEGVKNVVCVIQEAGNVSLETRCAGVNNNLPAAQATLEAKLQQDKSVDGIVTLGAQVASSAEAAISGAHSTAKLATFDLNADVAKGVVDGKIDFAVDQQPFLQGYLAVQMLTLYKSNLNVLGGGLPVLTGPNLVTKANAAEVLKLAAGGTR